jgi:hypothetical protein
MSPHALSLRLRAPELLPSSSQRFWSHRGPMSHEAKLCSTSASPQCQPATYLAKKVLPVDAGCGVTLELHLGGGRLKWLCLRDAGDFMVGAFNPVAPKLGQQDERKGPFSPQDLKWNSAEHHPIPGLHYGSQDTLQLRTRITSAMAKMYPNNSGLCGSHPLPLGPCSSLFPSRPRQHQIHVSVARMAWGQMGRLRTWPWAGD